MGEPSNDVLAERLKSLGEDLEAHREEAREAAAQANRDRAEFRQLVEERLDDMRDRVAQIASMQSDLRDLKATVNGEKTSTGIKGRVERLEFRVTLLLLLAGALVGAGINRLLESVIP
jgi:chromosome segregation ATPase